jgi:ABC-type uncharacterized transport system permease subunit
VYLGSIGTLGRWQLLALQAIWTLVLVGAGRAVLAAGQRKLTVQGG